MQRIANLIIALLSLAACNSEEGLQPAYRQELADLLTDSQGQVTAMTLDNGQTLALTNRVNGFEPDTMVRVLAAYLPDNDGARLAAYSPVEVRHLTAAAETELPTDPVELTACWKGKDYLNLRIKLKGHRHDVHELGFVQTDVAKNANGTQTLYACLLHDQNNDPLWYTQTVFLSLPLSPLYNRFQSGRDSLKIKVNTFKGPATFCFAL